MALAVAAVVCCRPGGGDVQPSRRLSVAVESDRILSLAFAPGGELMLSSSNGVLSRCWEAAGARGVVRPKGPAFPGHAAVLAPDGSSFASAGRSSLLIWDTATGATRTKSRPSLWSRGLAFTADATLIAESDGSSVYVWDARTDGGGPLTRLDLNGVVSLAFSPDGRTLAAGQAGGTLRLLDMPSGRERRSFVAHAHDVTALAFAGDGRAVASASLQERPLRLWDAASGRPLGTLTGHNAPAVSVAFSGGGGLAASISTDGLLRVWDVSSRRELAALRCDGSPPFRAAFSPDGRTLIAAGLGGEVWLWEVSSFCPPDARGESLRL
jgi:WD40 repeat protein